MGVPGPRIQGQNLGQGVTGVIIPNYVRGTLNLALRLHADTRNVVVVSGDSKFEKYWLEAAGTEIRLHDPTLQELELVGLSAAQLMERISALPPHTIVLFQLLPSASSQPAVGPYELLEEIARTAPTYCPANFCLGHGAVGGSYVDSSEQGGRAAALAARVLAGEKAENILIEPAASEIATVDWRQLQHWHISEAALPKGSVVLFRQRLAWQPYWRYVAGACALIALQAFLILGLLWERLRKRRAEAALRDNEERLRLMADTSPSLIWTSDKDGMVTFQNNKWLDFSTSTSDAAIGQKWTRYIHPEDLAGVLEANARAHEERSGFSKEYRLRRRDGVYRWMFDLAVPRISPEGTFLGFIGSAIDTTDQKLAQEGLETLSGKLIEAQEQERARIARELHDDICQRLALLSLELERSSGSEMSSSSRNARMMDVRERCTEIAKDVQALSHELHSSKLDYLGVVAATRSFCAEFSKVKDVNVVFSEEDVPYPLPKDISLCLFRVTQEALHNAFKHSGLNDFTVSLKGEGEQVRLEVRDRGSGFDAKSRYPLTSARGFVAGAGRTGLGLVRYAGTRPSGEGNLPSHIETRPRDHRCCHSAGGGAGSRVARCRCCRRDYMTRARILLADDHAMICAFAFRRYWSHIL